MNSQITKVINRSVIFRSIPRLSVALNQVTKITQVISRRLFSLHSAMIRLFGFHRDSSLYLASCKNNTFYRNKKELVVRQDIVLNIKKQIMLWRGLDALGRFPAICLQGRQLKWLSVYYPEQKSPSGRGSIFKGKNLLPLERGQKQSSRKHAYIILTPLNPTFIQ